MKRTICIILVIVSLFSIGVVSFNAYGKLPICSFQECSITGEGGSGTWRACPGAQGKRHSMVVYCAANDFWNGMADAHPGCMGGDENCYNMNPCKGGGWREAPGAGTICNPQ